MGGAGGRSSPAVLLEPCADAACALVATATTWPGGLGRVGAPGAGKNHLLTLKLNPMLVMDVAPAPTEVAQNEDVLILTYANRQIYAFHTVTAETLKNVTWASHLTVADSINITFTKSNTDAEPQTPADLRVWRQAINAKRRYFKNVTHVFMAQKGDITIYYFNNGEDPIVGGQENIAVVVNATAPYAALEISARRLSFNQFKNTLATLRSSQTRHLISP